MTYVLHRYGLHSEQSPITKIHSNWQHTVPAPFSLVAHYDHPVAYLIHVFLPTYLTAVIFRFHILTYLLYLAVVSLEETFAYSGYNMLPSSFVLGGMARRQEKHLMSGGNGNYGCFGLVDFAMGTSVGEDLVDDIVDEADERRVAKKTKGKKNAAGKKALKRAPRRNSSDQEYEECRDRGVAAETEEGEVNGAGGGGPPTLKTKGSSPKKGGKKGTDTYEEDAKEQYPEKKDEIPPKRLSRLRKSEKRSSEEDAEAGGQEDKFKAEEEKPGPKVKGVSRKGSQKSKVRSRPRKRSEDEDE